MPVALLTLVALAIQQASCPCPESIGAEAGSRPLVVVAASPGRPSLLACGYLESSDAGVVRASEFDVFSCESDKPVLSFSALQTATLRRDGQSLVITEVERWPFGPKWKWIDVPVWRYLVKPGTTPAVAKTLVLHPPVLTPRQISEALSLYVASLSEKGSFEHYEDVIGRVLAAALTGDEASRLALQGIRRVRPAWLDGAAAEFFHQALRTYQSYAHATGKVPELPGV